MQKSDSTQTATTAHRKVQSSTTLNRRYVSRPASMVDTTRKTIDMNRVNIRMKARAAQPTTPTQPSAQELKDRAIAKALANASKPEPKQATTSEKTTKKAKKTKLHFGMGRVVLALSCAAAAVFAIVYFVNLNMPDISMRVAAMQSGIEPKYPGYVPRDFSVNDVVAENGRITLNFRNSGTGDEFSIVEESSSWDSNALLSNYVSGEFGDDYTVIREQGLTIYMTNNASTWVNGGMLYKLNVKVGSLTKKQITSIASSL